MEVHYGLFRKSCTSSSGYIPVRSTKHKLFEAPLYLMPVVKYRKTVQAECKYTLSKGGKHLTSLFQNEKGSLYYGDIYLSQDALLIFLDGLTMEVFLFPGQLNFSEAYYTSFNKLPLQEVRLRARAVNSAKYDRQLICYKDKQLSLI